MMNFSKSKERDIQYSDETQQSQTFLELRRTNWRKATNYAFIVSKNVFKTAIIIITQRFSSLKIF